MLNVSDIAKFYLSKAPMTQKKLQTLVYYAYAWTFALLNDDEDDLCNKLFNEQFQAWVHGPVCPVLYDQYRRIGWNTIPQGICDESIFDPDVLDVLEQVWDVYGELDGNQLENICRQEQPWREARRGYPENQPSKRALDDRIIFQYYNRQLEQ